MLHSGRGGHGCSPGGTRATSPATLYAWRCACWLARAWLLPGRSLPVAALLVHAALVLDSPTAGAQEPQKSDAAEQFERVDPYTKGKAELVQQAGYLSLEPFAVAPGISAKDLEEVLGGIELLWAETAHFKLVSSLNTYKRQSDARESKLLEQEFVELAQHLRGFKAPRNSKLDPWLRLHLYALRLEGLYADFCTRLGYRDEEFPPFPSNTTMGRGPYLGQPQKLVVLLFENSSSLGRFNQHYFQSEESTAQRASFPGGGLCVGFSAEGLAEKNYALDTALHCALASSVVMAFLDGLCDSYWATPLWLDLGLGHWYAKRIDERFTFYAAGTSRYLEDDSFRWQPRVRGLVSHDYDYSWDAMLESLEWPGITPQQHLVMWSRIDWMLSQPDTKWRALLDPLTVTLPPDKPAEHKAIQVERATRALQAAFGKSPADCDAAWRAWVLKTYAKK